MTDEYYFTDTASATLEYSGDGDGEALFSDETTADFDPSGAETVTRDGPWTDFFDTDEFVQFDATVAQPITQPYVYDGSLHTFRKDEAELKQAQAQLDNLPWTMGHPPRDRVSNANQIRGVWSDPRYNDGQQATLNIPANDPDAVRFAVTNDEVSVGFGGTLDWLDDNDDVDAVQRDMAYDHVASVESGRCPPEKGCGLHTDASAQNSAHGGDHAEGTSAGSTSSGTTNDHAERGSAGSTSSETTNDHATNGRHGHVTDAVQTQLTEEGGTETQIQFDTGDFVAVVRDGERVHGRVVAIQDETVMVQPYDADEDRFEADAMTVDPSTLREWVGPQADSCPGPCSCGLHGPSTDVEVNGEDIDLVPPEAAQNAAQDALDARSDEGTEVNGMTDHGWSRAEQLASGEELSVSDIVGDTGAMAPWWSRHEGDIVDGDSLAGAGKDNPWEDNSYTAGKGWGGITGMNWALRKGDEIKRARGEDPVYTDTFTDAPDGLYVEDDSWYGIAPSETADDEPKYELDNCNDVKDAFNLRNNGDYQVDVSTLVERIKRASKAHDCPPEQKPWTDSHEAAVLAQAIKQSAD